MVDVLGRSLSVWKGFLSVWKGSTVQYYVMYVISPALFYWSKSLNNPLIIPIKSIPTKPRSFYFYSCVGVVAQQVSESCLLCLIDNVLVTSDSQCLTTPASDYEMTYGLMILSKKELKNQTVMPHNNQSQMRGILTASVRILRQQNACISLQIDTFYVLHLCRPYTYITKLYICWTYV